MFRIQLRESFLMKKESENDASGHEKENVIDNSNTSPKTTSSEENIVRKIHMKLLKKYPDRQRDTYELDSPSTRWAKFYYARKSEQKLLRSWAVLH